MNKVFGASCLVAGTAVGAGMMALPMVLAKIGLVLTVFLMIFVWGIAYYSALVGSELNLRANKAMVLGALARHLSGRPLELFWGACMMLISYALLTAYLGGGASLVKNILGLENHGGEHHLQMIHAALLFAILASGTLWVDMANRFVVIIKTILTFLVIGGIAWGIRLDSALPLSSDVVGHFDSWSAVLPVLFTSFGFQLMIHSLADYLNLCRDSLRRTFFWGSLLPVVIYFLWTATTLIFIYQGDQALYKEIEVGGVDVGRFIGALSQLAHWPSLKFMTWCVSILAIATSSLGVGLGMVDYWSHILEKWVPGLSRKVLASAITVCVPLLMAMTIPNAFIRALGFAGMILAIVALIIPTYLLFLSDGKGHKGHYKILESIPLRWLVIGFGAMIIVFEVLNMTVLH